jgi:Acetylornithine deacetylase/Succinyl-diaminopimelate desuccinylase and related deacylases
MAKVINELSLTKELIKIPSITPLDGGAIALVAKHLRYLGFRCTILNFKDKNTASIKNLYARLGTSSPNFCFAGHTDVVPTGNVKSWNVGPFSGIVKAGKIYGRGTSDMKGAIACFIAAVSKFLKIIKNLLDLLVLLLPVMKRELPLMEQKSSRLFKKKKKN